MALFSQQHRIWIESSAWLEQLALTPDGHIPGLLQQCRHRLTSVPWNTTVPGFSSAISFTTRSLALLLSSYDIFTILCDSLLGLIVSHRRFYSHYPSLHCEHLFGTLRKLKANFSLMDFLLFIPKVRILLSGEFGDLLPQQKANETADGYHHTYFQTNDIDLKTLMIWPRDEELRGASTIAFSEASDLLAVLGIDAAAISNMSGERN
jgi:hypothetical protein